MAAEGVAIVDAVTLPAPRAMSPAWLATAFGPIATLSRPNAWLSGAVLLAWKYLMPALLIALSAAPTLLTVDVVPLALLTVYVGPVTAPVDGLMEAPPPRPATAPLS